MWALRGRYVGKALAGFLGIDAFGAQYGREDRARERPSEYRRGSHHV
jgi:hypothetical protein